MVRRKRRLKRKGDETARLLLRLPEALRLRLEQDANAHKRSLNAEIVERLRESVIAQKKKPSEVIAQALVDYLDDEIVWAIQEIFKEQERADYLSDLGQDMEDEARYEQEQREKED